MNAVPEAYHGVWQRTLLRLSDGTEDIATRVFWLQSAHLHADLRIPDPTPKLPFERAAQAGFAGLTEATSGRCQWHFGTGSRDSSIFLTSHAPSRT